MTKKNTQKNVLEQAAEAHERGEVVSFRPDAETTARAKADIEKVLGVSLDDTPKDTPKDTNRSLPAHGASTITVVAEKNPKREGSKSHARFELYTRHPTVAEFVKAGGRRADLKWDTEHGFIVVADAKA